MHESINKPLATISLPGRMAYLLMQISMTRVLEEQAIPVKFEDWVNQAEDVFNDRMSENEGRHETRTVGS
jgi:hypothetical protein